MKPERKRGPWRGLAWVLGAVVVVAAAALLVVSRAPAGAPSGAVVWLCRPAQAHDPCAGDLRATAVSASGARTLVAAAPSANSPFDCFYVYPTVSRELRIDANLRIQPAEVAAAVAQAARFSAVCRVWAPMYRQVTALALAMHPKLDLPASYEAVAYASLAAAFQSYLAHDNDGRPIVFIGHSQGSALLIELLSHLVDANPSLRGRLLLAILPGGDVEVRTGQLTGGSFRHIPLCSREGETGCVISYSSFPRRPPASSLFGRPGQGVALQSGQTAKAGLSVACVNPAALSGGAGTLDPFFPTGGSASRPWVEYPGLYAARCETAGSATWLNVTKATGAADHRPVVTEADGPNWGYHGDDINLALGNLVTDVAAAEQSWSKVHPGTGS